MFTGICSLFVGGRVFGCSPSLHVSQSQAVLFTLCRPLAFSLCSSTRPGERPSPYPVSTTLTAVDKKRCPARPSWMLSIVMLEGTTAASRSHDSKVKTYLVKMYPTVWTVDSGIYFRSCRRRWTLSPKQINKAINYAKVWEDFVCFCKSKWFYVCWLMLINVTSTVTSQGFPKLAAVERVTHAV